MQVSADVTPVGSAGEDPHAQQGESFFSEEIAGGLQMDKLGSGPMNAVAAPGDTVVDNPGDCFVGAYQAAHDPELLQHTLGRSLPSPQLLPQVVDQMMENAELNTQTAVAVASLYKVTALTLRDVRCLYLDEIGCLYRDYRIMMRVDFCTVMRVDVLICICVCFAL